MRSVKTFLALTLAVLALASCHKEVPVTGLQFPESLIYLTEGEDFTLPLTVTPAKYTSNIQWTSSDPKVAEVEMHAHHYSYTAVGPSTYCIIEEGNPSVNMNMSVIENEFTNIKK